MHRLAWLVGAIALTATSVARAEYQFRFEQFDESGATIERAGWRCTDSQMKADRCTQGILLDIDGRPEPIDMQFRDAGGRLELTMSSGAWLVATTSARPLVFDHGVIASSIDAWETEQKIEPGLVHDLVLRPGYRVLAHLTLVVWRSPQP